MSYYGQFIHRQAELTQSTMEQARKALLEEAESEEAYRKSLMDRQKDLVDLQAELTKKLASAGKLTGADWKYYFGKKVSLETGRANQQLRTQSELQKLEDDARFDRARLEGLNKEIALKADQGDVQGVIDVVMGDTAAGIVRGNAQRAKQSGEAAQHDYALALTRFMEQRLTSRADGTMRELKQEERNALQQAAANVAGIRDWHAVNEATVQMMVDSDKAKFNSLISKPHGALLAELERWKDSPGDEAKVAMIRAALETKMAEGGVEAAEIESQLEALGRPMEVTEEAVRGRTQEMMEPYEGMTPFPIAAALGERFKKRMQERRGEKAVADFDDLSDDQQIIFQNAIKAEQWRTDLGGRLPSEDQMNTIEWKRAQEIMSQIESGTLDKRAMIRTALQFAEKDLGRGAPPTDVRRQRDEIIERVMMLRANTTAMGKANVKPPPPRERPKPVVEPAVAPAAAPAGTGRRAAAPPPSMDDYLASDAAMAGSALLPDTPVSTFAVGESPEFPMHSPEEAPTGSAVANILDPALATSSTEPQVSLYTPEEMGASPAPTPVRTATAVTAQPQEPRGSTPASWGGVSPTREETAARAQQSEERKAQEASAVRERRAWAEAAKIFSASQTPQDIPGLSTDPSVLAQLAEAARMAGLPLPGWYAALQAQDFFATPVASNP
jgi:hypothetical protein